MWSDIIYLPHDFSFSYNQSLYTSQYLLQTSSSTRWWKYCYRKYRINDKVIRKWESRWENFEKVVSINRTMLYKVALHMAMPKFIHWYFKMKEEFAKISRDFNSRINSSKNINRNRCQWDESHICIKDDGIQLSISSEKCQLYISMRKKKFIRRLND